MANMHGAALELLWRMFSKLLISLIIVAMPILAPSSIIAIETGSTLEKYTDTARNAASARKSTFITVPRIENEEMDGVYRRLRDLLKAKINFWQIILLDDQHLRLLRNEIFARHGYKFHSEDMQSYFSSFSWYKPKDAFTEASFSAIERENISMIKRVEDLKRSDPVTVVEKPGFQKISEVETPKIEPFENRFFKYDNGKVTFKRTGKTRVLTRDEGPDGRLYNYETASVFNDLPILFLHQWHLVGIEGPVNGGLSVYNAQGEETHFPNLGGDLYYAPQIDAFIANADEGMGGMSWGSLAIFDKQIHTLFSASFGDEQVGNGLAKYFQPIWSKNLVIWILGEITDKVVSMNSSMRDRVIILDSTGTPSIDIPLKGETIPDDIHQIALLSPRLLYISYAYNRKTQNFEQALFFLDKALPLYPHLQVKENPDEKAKMITPVGC